MKKKAKVTLFLVTVLLLLMAGLPLAFYAVGRYPLGLKVNGERLGGLSIEETEKRLYLIFNSKNRSLTYLLINGKREALRPEEIGVTLDAEKTNTKLVSFYFKDISFKLYLKWLKSFYLTEEVNPVFKVKRERLNALAARLNQRYGRPPQDAVVTFDENGNPVFKKEVSGLTIDKKELEKAVKKILLTGKPANLDLEKAEPAILTSDLKKLVEEQLELFKSKTLAFSGNTEDVAIKGTDLLALLKSGTIDGKLTFIIDPGKLGMALEAFFKKLEVKPRDASFEVVNGRVVIVPEKNGLAVDVTETAKVASRELYFSQFALVKPIFRDVEPELTAKEAEEYGIKELISSFTTDYNPHQTNRVANIKLLARLLDGQLVAPGEIFSFNERIGPRTLERGFLPAPTIINGRLVDTAGGGACQVGTTLFNAAFFAGLKIIERHNHSFYISHYPAGRDATVSYGGYDLKFKNDYQSWILIKAWATQSRITISFYGTAEGRKVRFETLGPFDFKPYKVREVKDANLPLNYRKVEDKGIKGRRYVVIRYVYDKLGNLVYKDKFVSIYRPKDEIVRVGIKKTEETTVTTQAANN